MSLKVGWEAQPMINHGKETMRCRSKILVQAVQNQRSGVESGDTLTEPRY